MNRRGFRPSLIAWAGPMERPPERCSYCGDALPDVPVRVWKMDGSAAAFCDPCSEAVFAFVVARPPAPP
jgi:hypothetical protein